MALSTRRSTAGLTPATAGAEPFIGRARELRLLGSMVSAAGDSGAATLVVGDPGIGKTALLRRVTGGCGATVRWICGAESEAVLPYAAAADLLVPLLGHATDLPGIQRSALLVSLALESGPPPTSLAVCAGALGVLSAAAEREPLVVVVDDLHWVDAESRRLLLFVARRLESERFVMLLTARAEDAVTTASSDVPTLCLRGLSNGECRELVDRRGLAACDETVARLAEATGGNPLALIATLEHRCPVVPGAPPVVQAGASAERAWGATLATLPDATRRALFAAATRDTNKTPTIPALLEALGLTLADLEPAERRHLVRLHGDTVELCHPLLRRVLIDETPAGVHWATLHALADASTGDTQVWYRSLTASGPDERVAAELLRTAERSRARSGAATAARFAHRAAELTEQPPLRTQRLSDAAVDALFAGDLRSAAEWSGEAAGLADEPAAVGAAALTRAQALTPLGHPDQAYDELIRQAERIRDRAPELAAELFAEATMPAMFAGRPAHMREAAEASERLWGGRTPSFRTLVLVASALLVNGEVARGRDHVTRATRLAASADPVREQHSAAQLAQAHGWLEEHNAAGAAFGAAIETARRHGTPGSLAHALAARSELEFWRGRWAAAAADANESLRWAEETGQLGTLGWSLATLGRLDAARGERSRCEEWVRRSRTEVGPHAIRVMAVYEASVLGLAALGAGEAEQAVDHLEEAWEAAARTGIGNPNIVPFVPDLVEAHLRTKGRERAAELVAWLESRAAATQLRFPAHAAARYRGLLTDGDAASAAFASAHWLLDGRPLPFEQARTLLCEGQSLRRRRHVTAARRTLREAHQIFERLGARPWAAAAEAELVAAGAPPEAQHRDRGTPALDDLSPQELQIARMVAAGRNNVETAAALFVSRKTIESHLTRVYRKLGLRSRTELAALLAARGTAT